MRTIKNQYDKVVCFDEKVWLQERQLMYFTHMSGSIEEHIVRLSVGQLSNVVARYALDSNDEVVIDVTDLIRSLETPQTLYLWCGHSISSAIPLTIPYSIGGLINPKHVLIPRTRTGMPIEPPTIMLMQAFDSVNISFEACADKYAYIYVVLGTSHEGVFQSFTWSPVSCSAKNIVSVRVVYLQSPDDLNPQRAYTNLIPLEDCKRYCAVRWVSFTGQTRCHTFEVSKVNTNTIDDMELMTIDGSYNVVKGREDRFSLRLENLTAYDLWYYSDVCHSSKVEVSMDGVEWQQVDVIANSVSVPDGDAGKFNTLNVELKWRKYDAVAM